MRGYVWLLVLILPLLLVGCGHPRGGDIYSVVANAEFYQDEAAFRDEVRREADGESETLDEMIRLTREKRVLILGNGARVQVIERVPGGVKVVAMGGEHDGQTGWITEGEMKRSGYLPP